MNTTRIAELERELRITIAEGGDVTDISAELDRLRGTWEYLAQQADAADEESGANDDPDRVPLHRRPGPLQDAYKAYRDRLRTIAEGDE